jgi:hypothetical protein
MNSASSRRRRGLTMCSVCGFYRGDTAALVQSPPPARWSSPPSAQLHERHHGTERLASGGVGVNPHTANSSRFALNLPGLGELPRAAQPARPRSLPSRPHAGG